MKRFGILSIALFALVGAALASDTPSADSLLARAQALARSEKKNVLVIFHASWCGWCKRLDTFLADPKMGDLITDNFVVLHLDVLESPEKKSLENAGGAGLMKGWNGEKSGLPFMVILDGDGKKLIDSNKTEKQDSNIGYPAKPDEIEHFMRMLQTGPRISTNPAWGDLVKSWNEWSSQGGLDARQRAQIETWLREHAPKG